MRLKQILIVILLCMFHLSHAQQDWAIRTNAGIASKAQFADGYYFSFDVGIPITRYLQIAPTFSFASINANKFISNSFTIDKGAIMFEEPLVGPGRGYESQDLVGSVSVLVLLNPLKLFHEHESKHEIWVGTGYGYKSYTQVRSSYEIGDQGQNRRSYNTKANSAWSPYTLKLMYNYAFHENLFGGLVIGMDGYDGEAVTNTGLQFGVRF